jgi:hypothetical protein
MNIHSLTPLILYDPRTTYLNKPTLIFLGGKDVSKVEIESFNLQHQEKN